jgi:glycosyltransferase involved in cell wall biosynthesis
LGAPEEKIHLIRCGCDTNLFISCKPSSNEELFVAVGRLVDKKAPYLTILAFHEISKKFKNAKLLLIGKGVLEESCHRLVHALGLDNSVTLKGECSIDEVAATMRKARAFLQHSITPRTGPHKGDSEGTPVSIIEAMATGLPVIATKHAGISEIINHNKTGFLVEEGDVKGMAYQMERILKEPDIADRVGKAAALFVKENFSLKNSGEKLKNLLFEVAKNTNTI